VSPRLRRDARTAAMDERMDSSTRLTVETWLNVDLAG
jgi:hypothetical protein